MNNLTTDQQDREVLALLRNYPAPAAETGFYDQALARATHEGSRRQRNRWLLAGFGAAIAATIAAWMIGGFLQNDPSLPTDDTTIAGVSITMEQPRTINLVFASAVALDSATLTVTLPDGIELEGFPGQRELTWETSLKEGRNLLPLTLVALTPAGGELLARLEHEDRDRTFRLRVDVT
jgi:hypothetical protein